MTPETTVSFIVLTKPSQRNVRTSGVVKMLHFGCGELTAVGEPGNRQIDDAGDGQQRHHRGDQDPPAGARARLVEQKRVSALTAAHRCTATRRSIQPPNAPESSAITT